MKVLGIVALIMSCTFAKGQVAPVTVKDSTFIRAISVFLDSVETLKIKDETVVVVGIQKLTVRRLQDPIDDPSRGRMYRVREELSYELSLSLNNSLLDFKESITPSFFFEMRNRKCFVTFRAENLFEVSEKGRKAILQQAGKSVREVLGSSVLAGMVIEVHGDQLKIGSFGHAFGPNGK